MSQDLPDSNELCLSMRDWTIVAVAAAVVVAAVPPIWNRLETFEPDVDYRVPFSASDDYGLWERLVRRAVDADQIVVIGDSVIWGEFVRPSETLSQALNAAAAGDDEGGDGDGGDGGDGDASRARFVNAGLNGSHPLALEGLVEYFGGALDGVPAVLHVNLLWLSSPQRDLDVERDLDFNHRALVPQIAVRVPGYRASADDRLTAIVDRDVPYRVWVRHGRVSWFEGLDVPAWALDHPYDNPLGRVSLELPEPLDRRRHPSVPWFEAGVERQDMEWVEPEGSLQLAALERLVALLEKRGVRLLVVVGPFNEHVLTEAGLRAYRATLAGVVGRLRSKAGRRIIVLGPLPREEYGDASHPLAPGYERMARAIAATAEFEGLLHAGGS